MQGKVAPAEKVGSFEDLRVVYHDEMVAVKHGAGVGETDEAGARGRARQIQLIPGVTLQRSHPFDLDTAKAVKGLRIRRRENLPVCIQQLRRDIPARKQAVHRFDDLGGIALHARKRL